MNSRENCGVVDRREIDTRRREENGKNAAVEKQINVNQWMKRSICKERSPNDALLLLLLLLLPMCSVLYGNHAKAA